MLLSFIFSLQFLSSSLASLTPKSDEIWRQTIIDKLGTGEELNSNTIESIKRNVYKLDSAKLELLQPLNENSLMLILHPCNFQGFMEDCSSVNNIKSKLSPKSFISFKINEVEITEEIQKKIFNSMCINEIADYLMNNQGFIDSGYQVFQGMTYSHLIQVIIRSRLRDIENLPYKALKVLLSPLNEDLILSYQADPGTTWSTHIKSRLCPDNFFSLEGTETSVPEEMQQEIFKLLGLKGIVQILVKYAKDPNFKLEELIKKEKIIKELRDEVVREHLDEVIKILTGITELNQFANYLGIEFIKSYSRLCEKIQETILYGKLEKLYKENKLYPNNFFSLEGARISVPEEMQKKIFKLLNLKQVFEILVKDEEANVSTCKLEELIKKEKVIKKLRDGVVRKHLDELIKILTEIKELDMFPEYLGKNTLYFYDSLCETIPKVILYTKFQASYRNSESCPKNFFPLEGTETSVPEEMQQEIFKLLGLKGIVQILVKYAKDPNFKLEEFIKKEKIIKELRDEVVREHLDEVIKILTGITELKQLAVYLRIELIESYSRLCEKIQEMNLDKKLTEPYKNGKLCPDNFFPLEDVGINVPEKIQQDIFKLIRFKEIVEILVKHEAAKDPNCKLEELIRGKEIVEKLREEVISNHLFYLVLILAEIEELYELFNYRNHDFKSYGELCETIRKIITNSKQNN